MCRGIKLHYKSYNVLLWPRTHLLMTYAANCFPLFRWTVIVLSFNNNLLNFVSLFWFVSHLEKSTRSERLKVKHILNKYTHTVSLFCFLDQWGFQEDAVWQNTIAQWQSPCLMCRWINGLIQYKAVLYMGPTWSSVGWELLFRRK